MIWSVQEIPRFSQSQLNYLQEGCYCRVHWVDILTWAGLTASLRGNRLWRRPKHKTSMAISKCTSATWWSSRLKKSIFTLIANYCRKGWQEKTVTRGLLTRNSNQDEPINSIYLATQSSTVIPQIMKTKNPLEIAVSSLGRLGNHPS